jgi:hypothetical protein
MGWFTGKGHQQIIYEKKVSENAQLILKLFSRRKSVRMKYDWQTPLFTLLTRRH